MSTMSALPFITDLQENSLPGSELEWLSKRRSSALASLNASGLPTRKWEEWKYTQLTPLENITYRRAIEGDGARMIDKIPSIHPKLNLPRLVFVEGFYRSDLSRLGGLPNGVTFEPLIQVLGDRPALI